MYNCICTVYNEKPVQYLVGCLLCEMNDRDRDRWKEVFEKRIQTNYFEKVISLFNNNLI